MRKLVLFLSLCILLYPLSAVEQTVSCTQVTVLPRDVYVGDEMEVRCTFSCDVPLLGDDQVYAPVPAVDAENFTIESITLQKSGSSYMLSLLCRAWTYGSLKLPPIPVSVVQNGEADGDEQENGVRIVVGVEEDILPEVIYVDVPEVTVKSIVEYTGASELRPVMGPILVPGTMWVVYVLSILLVTVITIVIVILVRMKSFRRKVKEAADAVVVFERYHSLRGRMKKLMKTRKEIPDAVFAKIVSRSVREFLSARFVYNFMAETPAGVVTSFERITGGIFSVEASMAVQGLSDILLRCDYIRFSGDTSEKGVLTQEERISICSSVLNDSECLRKDVPDV